MRCPLPPCSECPLFRSSALSGNSSVCNSISFWVEANIGQSPGSGQYSQVNNKPIHDVNFYLCYQKYRRQRMRVRNTIRKPGLLSPGLLPWPPEKMSLLGQRCCDAGGGRCGLRLLCLLVGRRAVSEKTLRTVISLHFPGDPKPSRSFSMERGRSPVLKHLGKEE